MTVRHPELARHFWATFYAVVRHNPQGAEAAVRNMITYLHLYPYSRFLIRATDARIAEIVSGRWTEPEPLPAKVVAVPEGVAVPA